MTRVRADVLLVAILALVAVGVFGAFHGKVQNPKPAPAVETLAFPTPTPSPTAGWWGTATPGPYHTHPLPTLPKVSVNGVEGKEGIERIPFTLASCPTDGVTLESISRPRPGWWNVYGTASIPNLWYWKVELSPDGKHWSELYHSAAPVVHALLVEFRTDTVSPGTYFMRLLAVDRTGNYPKPCVVQVEVK